MFPTRCREIERLTRNPIHATTDATEMTTTMIGENVKIRMMTAGMTDINISTKVKEKDITSTSIKAEGRC